ncbi:MAG: tRNA lysidine(34) synthetase TilS [Xanthomonadales bacterium]|nr:tRNA lysidine(34) synthetase TilS [Xanthomonadales bacterium]
MAHRRLRDLLEPALARLPPGPVAVAFSGGLDSTVLLHGLAALGHARARGLRAIHVDHGLQDDSIDWARHCRRIADGLGIESTILQVDVPRGAGLGLEASARRVRHAALRDALADAEILAFAHHRDDQAETVLLKMLRGAGPEGLAAMRVLRRFGHGRAWRPLLGLPRAALRSYAQHHGLGWIDDPSNGDPLFDRNYLRLDVLPRLRKRWPEADASITQSANWVRAAADYIDAQARHALAQVQGGDPATLRFRDWLHLPDALRDPVLRHWLRGLGLGEPNQHQVGELVRQLAEAGEDRLPCVRWPGAELRRYRDLVYALAPLRMVPPGWEIEWSGDSVELPAALGHLRLVDACGHARASAARPAWRIRFRRGGESLRMQGLHRELRDLFQAAGVPPWERGRIPLVFDARGTLHAVADLWLGDHAGAWLDDAGLRLQWTGTH